MGNKTSKPVDQLDDDTAEQVWRDLHSARGQLAAHGEEGGEDFKVTVLGGQWLMQHHGVATDCVQAHAANGGAIAWCREQRFNLSCRFAFSKYGAEAPSILCRAWARRMQHFYNHSKEHGTGAEHWQDADAAYTESNEFQTLVNSSAGNLSLQVAITKVRACATRH